MLLVDVLLNGFNALLVMIKIKNWSLIMEREILNVSMIQYFFFVDMDITDIGKNKSIKTNLEPDGEKIKYI
jgi:hypothetical protein